ncbi:MAG: DUF1501 domain-containing protein [Proteobacteria bacterium]|nr:DUF1501 domain-containing protein [Pseudomonadota bacterium]
MYRRQFLKYLGSSGLSLAAPFALAQTAAPSRFWVLVNAGGGWDPTYFIDPKGDRPRLDGRGPVNNYSVNAITSAGNIRFPASYPPTIDPPDANSPGHFANFFPRHANRLLVINGIDTQTNNHDAGSRFVWSGKIEQGYPSFGALAAAAAAPSEPLAYISNGGYDITASLVAPARIGEGEVFQKLAFPNASRPWEDEEHRSPYFHDAIYSEIELARVARINRLRASARLPLQRQQISELHMARSSDKNLSRLVQLLPERVSSGLEGQAEVAVAAFASGIAVSANMHIGGFDTHGNHDQNHSSRLTQLLAGVDHLWSQIEGRNLQDQVTVIVGSDFGRTPFYNDGRGKDHWNVTSLMAMGAGVRGNRVVGGTDDHAEALKINPQTLLFDPAGITLTPQHVHLALRSMAGIGADLTGRFRINETAIDLFS